MKKIRSLIFIIITCIVLCVGVFIYNNNISTRHAVVRSHIIKIAPQVSGKVEAVNVRHNQMVKKGDALFSIDRMDYEIALNEAYAGLEQTKQKLNELDAAIEVAEANVKAAKDSYNYQVSNFKRLKKLHLDGYISINEFEKVISDLNMAKNYFLRAQASLEQVIVQRGKRGANNATLMSAMSNVHKAELNLSRTLVQAPIDGVLSNVSIKSGDYVESGQPVLAEVDRENIWIEAVFPETVIEQIQPGAKARIVLMANTKITYEGYVESIGTAIESKELSGSGIIPKIPQVFAWVRLAENVPVIIRLRSGTDMGGFIPGLTASVVITR